MPNGRTIYKVMIKNRARVFWGARAFVVVRLPRSLLPDPPPQLERPEWGERDALGSWVRTRPDGATEIRSISCLMSSRAPEDALFVQVKDDDPEDGWVEWWEGRSDVFQGELKPENMRPGEPIAAEDVATERNYREWCRQFVDWQGEADLHPVIEAFAEAGGWAQTHYGRLTDRHLYVLYSVKACYPDRMRKVAAGLKRAFRVARAHGVDAKLMRHA